jgi:hypothetical protein
VWQDHGSTSEEKRFAEIDGGLLEYQLWPGFRIPGGTAWNNARGNEKGQAEACPLLQENW